MLLSKICKIHCKNVYFLLMASRRCAFHVSSSVPFVLVMCKTLFPTEICSFFDETFTAYMGSIVLKARSMQNHGKYPNCPPPFHGKLLVRTSYVHVESCRIHCKSPNEANEHYFGGSLRDKKLYKHV